MTKEYGSDKINVEAVKAAALHQRIEREHKKELARKKPNKTVYKGVLPAEEIFSVTGT